MVRSEKSNVIPINDQYRITSDRYQWMIQEKRNRTGKAEEWEPKSYFPTLEGAVKELGEQMVRLSGAESIEDVNQGDSKRYHHALPGSPGAN